jgi:hypothetical protein
MAKGEISPRFVGKVDQDLAAARVNLVQHVADMRKMLADGESTEVVFMHFAQTMLRETNAFHLAIMFAATTLTLAEQKPEDQTFPDAPWMYDFYFWGSGKTGDVRLMHRACHNCVGVIPPEPGLGFVHAGKLAELHLQGCHA